MGPDRVNAPMRALVSRARAMAAPSVALWRHGTTLFEAQIGRQFGDVVVS